MDMIGDRFLVDPNWGPYEGDISSVYCAVDRQNSMAKVAIKVFEKDAFEPSIVMEAFKRECESLQKLSHHKNIVRLIDLGRDKASGSSYLALEWCDANLQEHLRQYPEPAWDGFYRRYGRDILDALRFAYSQDVLHRDVKPQNVMINRDGQACVTDFGISKFRRYYRPGVTLAHFKSIPYSPPEDSAEFADTRDVFSFAVLCFECISGSILDDYDAVKLAAQNVDLPAEIREILSRCISDDPALRPANIVILYEEINSAVSRASTLSAVTREIPIHLTNKALEAARANFNFASNDQASRHILRELNEICGVAELESAKSEIVRHFALISAEFRCRAVIDRPKGSLSIIGLSRQSYSVMERQREKAWQPLLRFEPTKNRENGDVLDWFESEFDEFLSTQRMGASRLAETELFDRWSAALRAKENIQNLRNEPICFTDSEVDGTRLILAVQDVLGDQLSGQQRWIRVNGKKAIYGEIERTDGDSIILYCGTGQDISSAPRAGTLEFDNRQSQIALKRQQAALDAVKFGRNTRPDLRDLLTGKKTPGVPVPPQDVVFFQNKLDDDKKAAVCAALGTDDLIIIEGPPGTGKTKFITEVVAQVLRRQPGARVLLSSQTHVALDHALINIDNLCTSMGIPFKAVRIARRDDEKVSTELSHLMLEQCVSNWLRDAILHTERFLIEWASKHDISADHVRIGMVLAELRVNGLKLHNAQMHLVECRESLAQLDDERSVLVADDSKRDDYRMVVAEIRIKQEEITKAEELVATARQSFQATNDRAKGFEELAGQINNLNEKDLVELEEYFINHSSHGPQYRRLLNLAEEWHQRFGQSSDFHGAFVGDCDLVGGTCLGVAAHALHTVEFDICIIDEASKATPTEMLVPMAKSKKWIIVGDPKQLPPFVDDSREAKRELTSHGFKKDELRRTLLDHFIEVIPKSNQVSLLTQHRMVKPIGDLVSHSFYNGTLKSVNTDTCKWLEKAQALPKPVTWINTAENSGRFEQFLRGTYVNAIEVEAIERLLARLQLAASQRKSKYSVALLSGYGGQVAALDRSAMALQRSLPDLDVETGTVDSYQGREADIAVYSITRSNTERTIGFLKERERLNVALSRAKLGLAIVGDSVFCDSVSGKNPFADVLYYIRSHPNDCAIVKA